VHIAARRPRLHQSGSDESQFRLVEALDLFPIQRSSTHECHWRDFRQRARSRRQQGIPYRRPHSTRVTETKASYKTTEFIAYVAVLAGILIAGAIISGDGSDNTDFFGASRVWLYATILTVGYMISRGLAKAGSRDPYDGDRH